MPESKEKTRCFHPKSKGNARARLFGPPISPSIETRNGTQRQVIGFTDNQVMRLRVGDMRMARMQASITRLRHEMEQSKKMIEQLYQEAQLDINKI